MKTELSIIELVKNTNVEFSFYRGGFFYYIILKPNSINLGDKFLKIDKYQFHIPIEDIGNATLPIRDKAITYMRWIRKCLEEGTLVELHEE